MLVYLCELTRIFMDNTNIYLNCIMKDEINNDNELAD